MINLEVGKCYLTRDGRKFGPLVHCHNDKYPFTDLKGYFWTPSGKFYQFGNMEDGRDIVSEYHTTPVQEVTKKQLVAGEYGIVTVYQVGDGEWRYELTKSNGTSDELRQAAATLIEIAEYLSNDQA